MKYTSGRKGFRTPNYKFTVDSPSDPLVNVLREECKRMNKDKASRRSYLRNVGIDVNIEPSRVRLRPRGPRDGNIHDTPVENATHFDVYLNY